MTVSVEQPELSQLLAHITCELCGEPCQDHQRIVFQKGTWSTVKCELKGKN